MDFLSAYKKTKEKLAVTSEAIGANFPYTTTNGKYENEVSFWK